MSTFEIKSPKILPTPDLFEDDRRLRQRALISNLWVILATIVVSAVITVPNATIGMSELLGAFGIYFISNCLALWAAYRGANRLAVHGYTAQVFICNTLGMICMGDQHAHIVVAMVNFVLLHAVVFGQTSALVVTGILLSMLVISAQIDAETAYLIATTVGVEDAQRSITEATAFPSLLTTTLSTGYLIATTIHLKRQARAGIKRAFSQLEEAKTNLQARHDQARILAKSGVAAAMARTSKELNDVMKEALELGLSHTDFELRPLSDGDTGWGEFGTGTSGLNLVLSSPSTKNDEWFLTTLAAVINGAHSRINTDVRLRKSEHMEGVGRLAASVAHDFNNLLVPIQGGYDLLLRDETLTQREHGLIGPAMDATRQAKVLVKKLLVHASASSVNLQRVNFAEIVKSSEGLLRSFIVGEIELSLEISDADSYVLADPIELEQVLLNLVLNALVAVGEKGRVLVALVRTETEVSLEVSDNGPGIPPSLRDWVLEPFNSTRQEGTGLGLSTVKRIATAGAGELSISESSDGGASITFSLPRVAESISQVAPKPTSMPQTSELLILLVEDDKRARFILCEMLQNLGHNVIALGDGLKAEALLERPNKIDLLITDYQMPSLNGLQLIQRLRKRGDHRPTILLSGYGMAVPKLTPEFSDLVVSKPILLPELEQAINQVMKQSSAEQSRSNIIAS